jgi:hypothetical protein
LKRYRSPQFNIDPADPQFRQKLMAYIKRASDNLPTSVQVTLEIDPRVGLSEKEKQRGKASGHSRTIATTVWVPASIETFRPSDTDYFEPTEIDETGGSGVQ